MNKNASMNQKAAISRINKRGVLLVFPNNNRKEPHSLWSEFFPRKKLRWEWDESGDRGVFDMWTLMKQLSDGKQVVYSKWYQNRATFFSRELFQSMLCVLQKTEALEEGLSRQSKEILEILEQDSPLSTRELKRATDLQGRLNESFYNKGLKELFQRLLVVGFGEVDDGAFPSLAMGATKLLYEDLWLGAKAMEEKKAWKLVNEMMPEGSSFRKTFEKVYHGLRQ